MSAASTCGSTLSAVLTKHRGRDSLLLKSHQMLDCVCTPSVLYDISFSTCPVCDLLGIADSCLSICKWQEVSLLGCRQHLANWIGAFIPWQYISQMMFTFPLHTVIGLCTGIGISKSMKYYSCSHGKLIKAEQSTFPVHNGGETKQTFSHRGPCH